MNGELFVEAARFGIGGTLVVVGLVFMAGGALGMSRFPDFYTRLHALGVSDAVGGALTIAGLAFASWDIGIALRLALLAMLILVAAPSLSHMLANAAHGGGLAPIAGAYSASRSGKKK